MGGKFKSISLAAIMLLSTLSGIMMAAPAAATQVVITEADATRAEPSATPPRHRLLRHPRRDSPTARRCQN